MTKTMTWNEQAGGASRNAGDSAPLPEPVYGASTTDVRHLTQSDLAACWRISPRSLERWRMENKGPAWLRLPGRVVYRLEDVRAYEAAHLSTP